MAKLEEKRQEKEAKAAEREREIQLKAAEREAKKNQPKKPRSSYLIYCKETRQTVVDQARPRSHGGARRHERPRGHDGWPRRIT